MYFGVYTDRCQLVPVPFFLSLQSKGGTVPVVEGGVTN